MRLEHTFMLIKKYICVYLYKYGKTIKHNTINCFKKMYNIKIIQNIELYYILIQNDCVIVDVINYTSLIYILYQ